MGGHKAGEVASSIAIMRLNEMDVSEDLSVQEIGTAETNYFKN